jgi:replicative DNA helicase
MHPHDLDPDLLPWSQEAEKTVLGGLLLDNGAWDRIGGLIEAGHFYDPSHGLIFTAIAGMLASNKPADLVTVYDELQQQGAAEQVGGLAYLSSLSQAVPSASNIRRYAEIVAERALMRGMIEGAEQVKELAVKPGISVAERLDKAQGVLQSLQVSGGRVMPTTIDASVVRLLDRIQDAADGKLPRGVPTTFYSLDRMLGGGLKGGKQVIIAARPSIGKSSLAEQICLSAALAGYPAAFFSQEMSKDELTDRAVANLGRIELDNIVSGQLSGEEWARLTEAVERLRNLPLYLDDQPALTLYDISAKARMLKRKHGVKLIAIDYLQLCASTGKSKDSRHHEIEGLSRGLKNLAKQLDLCFLSLSQLNREVEKRTSGRPILSDLKESGSIEEDADVVMLLSRASTTADGFQIINCDVPKNRQGKVGGVTLEFNGAHQLWHETARPLEFKTPARKHFTEDV